MVCGSVADIEDTRLEMLGAGCAFGSPLFNSLLPAPPPKARSRDPTDLGRTGGYLERSARLTRIHVNCSRSLLLLRLKWPTIHWENDPDCQPAQNWVKSI